MAEGDNAVLQRGRYDIKMKIIPAVIGYIGIQRLDDKGQMRDCGLNGRA